jgi:Skp family chaperone for outer membrane proteins
MIATGALVALGVVFCIGRLWAQATSDGSPAPATPAAAPLRTRIAVVNIAYILKWYSKAKVFNDDMQKLYKPYQDREKELMKQRDDTARDLNALPPTAEGQREELAKKYKQITRDLEDNKLGAQVALAKSSGAAMKTLYTEILQAAHRYARAHDFDMVLQYADAFEPQDFDNPALIERKLKTSPMLPLYMAPGMNISQQVVVMLNEGAGPAPGAGSPAPAGGGDGK